MCVIVLGLIFERCNTAMAIVPKESDIDKTSKLNRRTVVGK